MSVSQVWMHVLLSDDEADQESPPDPTERAIFAEWEADPRSILPRDMPGRVDAAKLVLFHSRFNLPGFLALGQMLVSNHSPVVTLTEENTPKVVFTRNITPVSIPYFALGPQTSKKLPCRLGNLFLRKHEVPAALASIESAFEFAERPVQVSRGVEFYGGGYGESHCEDAVVEIMEAWPAALAIARKRNQGFVSLGFSAP